MQGAERLGTPRLLYPDREEMREAFSFDWDETKKELQAVFPDDMSHGGLSRRLHFMKREAGGEEILCKISEGFIREGKREGKLEAVLALMETTKWDARKGYEHAEN